jgi:hypothetical protein
VKTRDIGAADDLSELLLTWRSAVRRSVRFAPSSGSRPNWHGMTTRLLERRCQPVAWGFRALFNQHDAVALLRKGRLMITIGAGC